MREGLLVSGKYKLLKLIGSGGMGAVWLARNEMTEREFAIKFLHPQAANNPKVLTRFLQEAKVSGRLRHPSILEIFDVGTAPEVDGAPFLVMELLEGAPLDVAIRTLNGLPLRLTLQIALAMARALAVAHEKGVVHRDLKPANVFLHRLHSGGVVPKLLDFGISKLSPLDVSGGDSGMGLTQTGAVLGSPLYMSPEQAAGDKHVDGRSDIHALGVLMWWCIVGRSPFKSVTYNTLVVEIITGERPRILDVKPDLLPGVSDIVTKAFARRREDRYENTAVLAAALEVELAKLGPGPSLDSREWVEDIFSRIHSMAASAARGPTEPKEMTTNGAVSVSIDDILPESSQMRSPAAYTMDSKRSIALAPTEASQPSRPSGAGAVQGATMSASASAANARRFGLVPLLLAAGLGAFLLGAVGIGVVAITRGGAHGASSATAAMTSEVPRTSAGSAATAATPTPTPPAEIAVTAPVDAGASSPAPTATHPPSFVGPTSARPAAPPAQPPARPPPQKPSDPFHGI